MQSVSPPSGQTFDKFLEINSRRLKNKVDFFTIRLGINGMVLVLARVSGYRVLHILTSYRISELISPLNFAAFVLHRLETPYSHHSFFLTSNHKSLYQIRQVLVSSHTSFTKFSFQHMHCFIYQCEGAKWKHLDILTMKKELFSGMLRIQNKQ